MPAEIKIIIAATSSLLLIGADLLYMRWVLQKRIVPHSFSWLAFAALTALSFAAQLAGKAGPGAVITGVNTLLCLSIFILSLKYGVKKFAMTDWLCLAGALTGAVLWRMTDNPLWAAIIASLTDILAILPTYRKIYLNPHQDSPLPFGLGVIAYGLTLLAISDYNWTTILFPLTVVVNDSIYVLLVILRRRVVLAGNIS